MKNVFIINPISGKESSVTFIEEKLRQLNRDDIIIYITKSKGDAIRFCKEFASKNKDELIRFFACGGDGTLNEVVNGSYGFGNVEVGCYPCGSGNDFVKCFKDRDFKDFNSLLNGEAKEIDLYEVNGRFGINICNFGFDTAVARNMEKFRKKPLMGGKNAYLFSVMKCLLTSMKTRVTVLADGEKLNKKDEILLCTVANGQYVGGSYNCAPRALLDDGKLDVCFVHPVSRLKFVKLAKLYQKGLHLDNKKFEKVIEYRRVSEVELEADKGFAYTVDGEITPATHAVIRVVPHAIKFVVPKYLLADVVL